MLVLDPVDGKAAAAVVNNAKSQGVPVVAYDRFIAGADYYVSFDNETVGKLQGETLVDILKKDGKTSGNLVMINGAPRTRTRPTSRRVPGSSTAAASRSWRSTTP